MFSRYGNIENAVKFKWSLMQQSNEFSFSDETCLKQQFIIDLKNFIIIGLLVWKFNFSVSIMKQNKFLHKKISFTCFLKISRMLHTAYEISN